MDDVIVSEYALLIVDYSGDSKFISRQYAKVFAPFEQKTYHQYPTFFVNFFAHFYVLLFLNIDDSNTSTLKSYCYQSSFLIYFQGTYVSILTNYQLLFALSYPVHQYRSKATTYHDHVIICRNNPIN